MRNSGDLAFSGEAEGPRYFHERPLANLARLPVWVTIRSPRRNFAVSPRFLGSLNISTPTTNSSLEKIFVPEIFAGR